MARERIAINSTANSSRFPSKPVEILTGDRVITLAEIDQYQAFAFCSPSTGLRGTAVGAGMSA